MIDEKKIIKELEKKPFTNIDQKNQYKKCLEHLIKNVFLSEGKVLLSSLNQGDEFESAFGRMIILEQYEDKTLVITKDYIGEQMKFSNISTDFNTSIIKEFLLEKILPMFKIAFGEENIVEETTILESVHDKTIYGSYTGKIRLITYDEATKYKKILKGKLTGNYWAMTSFSSPGTDIYVSVGKSNGQFSVGAHVYDKKEYIRPVLCLKNDIFVQRI